VERQISIVSPVQVIDEVPPPLSSDLLRNKYYLLRHGQSTANVAEVISSCRSLAYTSRHGLTDLGYNQGMEASAELLDILERTTRRGERLVFVSSPFARAYQTAQACLTGLESADHQDRLGRLGMKVSSNVEVHDDLVERYFGRLDGQALYTYGYVWPLDMFDSTHTAFDVESVAAVCARFRSVIQDLEVRHGPNCHVVLVSHADVLQIAQLYASGSDNVGSFSSYRFKNGEIREMVVGSTDFLPKPVPLEPPQRGIPVMSQTG
jgi:broad specificity phosphatase PhoE